MKKGTKAFALILRHQAFTVALGFAVACYKPVNEGASAVKSLKQIFHKEFLGCMHKRY